jgi:hypothetical protein
MFLVLVSCFERCSGGITTLRAPGLSRREIAAELGARVGSVHRIGIAQNRCTVPSETTANDDVEPKPNGFGIPVELQRVEPPREQDGFFGVYSNSTNPFFAEHSRSSRENLSDMQFTPSRSERV